MDKINLKFTTNDYKNSEELKIKLMELSILHPELTFTCLVVFNSIYISGSKKVSSNQGESCYELYKGFFKAGKIVKPSSAWMRQYNYIPVRD